MEIFVIGILAMIVFNIIGSLIKRVNEGSNSKYYPAGAPQQQRPGVIRRDYDPAYNTGEARPENPPPLPVEQAGMPARPVPDQEIMRRHQSPATIAAAAEAHRVAGKLQHIFTDKEQLVSAFIFHEILDPPRSRR
ncbi:MAG: hypothetical protein AB1767_12855 [Bacillota bacterium]